MLELKENTLVVSLPEGKTNSELLSIMKEEIKTIEPQLYGLDLNVSGRITTHLAMLLGHILAHITKSVSLFDPKLNIFVLVISH